MKLIIIEGPTATGKSTIARKLAQDINIAAYLKDEYKETQFSRLQRKPTYRELRRIEAESWENLFMAVQQAVTNNQSLIVEANFYPVHRREFRRVVTDDTELIEVFCYARGSTILRRYIKRNQTGQRHPGHRDKLWYPLVALESMIIWFEYFTRPLRLTKRLIKVNTTDFTRVDYKAIENFVTE